MGFEQLNYRWSDVDEEASHYAMLSSDRILN
jgi:hypothetical protein